MTKIKQEQLRLMIKSIKELSKYEINSTTKKIIVNFLNLHFSAIGVRYFIKQVKHFTKIKNAKFYQKI